MTITSVTPSDLSAAISIRDGRWIDYRPPNDPGDHYEDTFHYTLSNGQDAKVFVRLLSPTASDSIQLAGPDPVTLRLLDNDPFGPYYQGDQTITSVGSLSDASQVSISADGKSVVLDPASPSLTFTYTVDDQFTEDVRVYPVGFLRSDNAVVDQNGSPIEIDVLANDFQMDRFSYEGAKQLSVDGPSEHGGALRVVGDRVEYTPAVDFVGTDSFTYTIDQFFSSQVTVHVIRRAADDTVRVSPDSQLNELNVRANDVLGADYLDAGLITHVSESTGGAQLQVSDDGRNILYSPPNGFVGRDSFVYTIDHRSKATVTVQVRDQVDAGLESIASADSYRDLLIQRAKSLYQYRWGNEFQRHLSTGGEITLASDDGLDFSETNVQVAGVDEHDVVETDGNYIYSLRGSELVIVSTLPSGDLEVVSRTEIQGNPTGMFLSGDRIAVLSERSEYFRGPFIQPVAEDGAIALGIGGDVLWPGPIPSTTTVTILDVSDRAAPSTIARTELDGRFVDARRIDDQVLLVIAADALVPEIQSTCDDQDQCVYETEQEYIQRITEHFGTVLQDSLPSYESYDGDGNLIRGGPVVLPDQVYVGRDDVTTMNLLLSLDMQSSEPGLSDSAGVLSTWDTKIFASTEHVYLMTGTTDSIEREPWTEIQSFRWDSQTGEIQLGASGAVPGRVLNQFSADDRDGMFRVTTQISNSYTGNYSGDDETGVFVLQDNGGIFEFVGSLTNLSLGHSVKSVRYFGDQLFVTTYSTVDPLHAIDLSDPARPTALGYVPIIGFNRYMQFVREDRLLTVGVNSAGGASGGAMISLFDVSDLNAPRLMDQVSLPRFSVSQANNDHHAFGWFAKHGLLSLPVSRYFSQRYDADQDGYEEAFRTVRQDELQVFNVTLDTTDLQRQGISTFARVDHDAAVQRSVSIDGHVYSIGDDGVRVISADGDGTTVAELPFDWQLLVSSELWSPIDHTDMTVAVRNVVSQQTQAPADEIVLVTRERRGQRWETVVAVDGRQYLVSGSDADDQSIVDDEFEFVSNLRHNRQRPMDANGDGDVTVRDALLVINELSRSDDLVGDGEPVLRQVHSTSESYSDTNSDGIVTPLDALLVINELAVQQTQSAFGQASAKKLTHDTAIHQLIEDDESNMRLF